MDRKEERALVKETKALIEEVEAGDSEHAAWVAIRDRVRQLYDGRTQKEVGSMIGKSRSWVGDLLAWDASVRRPTPFGGDHRATLLRDEVGAKSALRDPKKRKKVIDSLDPTDLIDLRSEAEDRIDEEREARARKKVEDDLKAGKVTMSTIAAETGEDPADIRASLTESWCDSMILRVNRQASKLSRHVKKYGLVIHSFEDENDQATDEKHYLDLLVEAEKDIADVRAALQERVRDREGAAV